MQTTEYVTYDRASRKYMKSMSYRNFEYVYSWTSDLAKAKRYKEPRAFSDENGDLECRTVKVVTSVTVEEAS